MKTRPNKGLKAYRLSKKFRLVTLAKLAGISVGYLSEVENGKKTPSLRVLKNIAEVYEVSTAKILELFYESEDLRAL